MNKNANKNDFDVVGYADDLTTEIVETVIEDNNGDNCKHHPKLMVIIKLLLVLSVAIDFLTEIILTLDIADPITNSKLDDVHLVNIAILSILDGILK